MQRQRPKRKQILAVPKRQKQGRILLKRHVRAAPPPPPPPPPPAPPTAFNSNPLFATKLLTEYIRPFKLNVAVETGTWHGTTTEWFASHLAEVHTVELKGDLFQENKARFAGRPHVKLYLGNSPDVLTSLLPTFTPQKRAIFYLDAHWFDNIPVNDELLAISKSVCKNNCLIVIDDFCLPDRPDFWCENWHGTFLNLAHIEKNLRIALPDLCYEYYAPPPGMDHTRARLLAYPTHWKKEAA